MIELGRIDTIIKVSLLLSHLALPRKGHLDAAAHVMAYVGQRHNSRLLYDPKYPEINYSVFMKCDCSEFYWNAEEAIHMTAPAPRGISVDIPIFVANDCAGDTASFRSRSCFLIYFKSLSAMVFKEAVYS